MLYVFIPYMILLNCSNIMLKNILFKEDVLYSSFFISLIICLFFPVFNGEMIIYSKNILLNKTVLLYIFGYLLIYSMSRITYFISFKYNKSHYLSFFKIVGLIILYILGSKPISLSLLVTFLLINSISFI